MFGWIKHTLLFQNQKHKRGDSKTSLHFGRVFLSFIFCTPTSMYGRASLPLIASIFETGMLTRYTLNFASCLYLLIYFLASQYILETVTVSMCRAALFSQGLYNVVGVFLDMKCALLSVTISCKAEWQSGKNMGFTSRLSYLFGCAVVNKLLTFFEPLFHYP